MGFEGSADIFTSLQGSKLPMLQIKSIADTFPVTTQTSWHIASDLITTAGEERGSIATEYLFTQGLSTVVDLRSRFPVVTLINDAIK